jgi:hypothetical protein
MPAPPEEPPPSLDSPVPRNGPVCAGSRRPGGGGVSSRRKPHAILTASDARCGDFLRDHWLRSLRENVDLENVDVVVLDFGLTPAQRAELSGVVIVPASSELRVSIARFREIARFLERHDYDQVLAIDAGDVLFQRDLSDLFEREKERFRVVQEHHPLPLGLFLRGLPRALRPAIRGQLRGKPTINSGFILAPSGELRRLGQAIFACLSDVGGGGLIRTVSSWLADQIVASLLLYEWGFSALDETYNFVLTARSDFRVEAGIFFKSSGEKIAVVHNAGVKDLVRVVGDFGYGPHYNTRIRRRSRQAISAWSRVRRTWAGPGPTVPSS